MRTPVFKAMALRSHDSGSADAGVALVTAALAARVRRTAVAAKTGDASGAAGIRAKRAAGRTIACIDTGGDTGVVKTAGSAADGGARRSRDRRGSGGWRGCCATRDAGAAALIAAAGAAVGGDVRLERGRGRGVEGCQFERVQRRRGSAEPRCARGNGEKMWKRSSPKREPPPTGEARVAVRPRSTQVCRAASPCRPGCR